MQIKNGTLQIVHVGFGRFMLKMSVLFNRISIEGKERKISCETKVYDIMRTLFYDFMIFMHGFYL